MDNLPCELYFSTGLVFEQTARFALYDFGILRFGGILVSVRQLAVRLCHNTNSIS
jgi:hypothetical protein